MSSIKTPKSPSSDPGPPAPSTICPPDPRFGGEIGLGVWMLLPWPAVGAGLYVFHSALIAFALYATVCLLGAWQIKGNVDLRLALGVKIHLGVAILAHFLLVGGYALLGHWVMPIENLRAGLASAGVTRASFLWLFPYFLIGNPLVEEKFWRGSVQPRVGRNVAAIFFGAWHWLAVSLFMPWWSAILATLGVMVVGLALGEVPARTKTLGDAILLHALAADLPLLVILAIWL
jgi:membrane protease YdiL (CAAX protease family)